MSREQTQQGLVRETMRMPALTSFVLGTEGSASPGSREAVVKETTPTEFSTRATDPDRVRGEGSARRFSR